MAITFQPKTENELREANLIAAKTICDFEVLEANDKVSKAGNDMIELKLKVYRPDGGYIFVNDYLLASMEFKLRHSAAAIGALVKYNKGALSADDFTGKSGKLIVGIQKSEDPQYPDKNVVKDYIEKGSHLDTGNIGDEIPFAWALPLIPFLTLSIAAIA